MKEQVSKYMMENARVFTVLLNDAVFQTGSVCGAAGEDLSVLGRLMTFACCIAALQKEEEAAVTVSLHLNSSGYAASADPSGTVRGRLCEADGANLLEVTLRLPLRGTYTGVVCGDTFEELVRDYFEQSLQISAACRIGEKNGVWYCVLAEQLPGVSCDVARICGQICALLEEPEHPEWPECLEQTELRYGCSCSRSSILRMIEALPLEDQAELSENGKIVTYCNSCGKKYTFEL